MNNIGKHFIVGFPDSEMNPELASKLKQIDPAGIILYDINFRSREQIKKLTDDLKDLLGENLIISTDEEGGKVQRLRRFVDPLPSFKALGMRGRHGKTEANAVIASPRSGRGNPVHQEPSENWILTPSSKAQDDGIEIFTQTLSHNLTDLGFNLAYSPCADLNTESLNPIIGPRSFGNDPKQVSQQVKSFIEALNKTSIISCAKHFPGHGASISDSHLGLPKITYKNYQEFEKHLEPFKAAIEAKVDMVMIAHLAIEILGDDRFSSEKDLPTSLSKKFIQGLLRDELGFQGLVISDEVTMKALERFGDCTERARLMLEAGNDLIIWHTNINEALKAATSLQGNSAVIARSEATWQSRITKDWILTPSSKAQDDVLEIGVSAIETLSPIPKLNLEKTILIYNKHPKLERDIIDRVFTIPKMEFSAEKNPCEFALDKFENILVLEFQTALNPQLNEYLAKLKAEKANVFIISTDLLSPHADINLNGCGELHFIALLKQLN